MNNKNYKKHITALMAAMAVAGTSSVFAATGLVENPQVGVVYVSANDSTGAADAQIRFGQNSTTGGGGAAVNNTTIASLATADIQRNLVFTPLNNVSPELTNETKGGLLIDPTTGNTTVKQASKALDTILPGLVRVRQQEVWSNDASVPAADRGVATGTPASTVYGTLNGTTFTPRTLSAGTQAAIETFVAAPTADNAKALMNQISGNAADRANLSYTVGAPVTVGGTGNFSVEGVTSTKGITNTGSISTDSLTVGGVAAATVNDVKAEAKTREDADTAIRTEFRAADTAIRGEFAAADVTLQNKINAEAATRLSEDTKLQANIDDEVANRIADVNAEETRARAAEVALANRATSLESRSTALEGRSTALEGRATALEGRVGRAEGRINSLRKGVSMAAALQTPVIEAGKQNAVKAGVATVDGAQGFGIAVARRINESVQVNLDVATDFETDTAARAGVNYSF